MKTPCDTIDPMTNRAIINAYKKYQKGSAKGRAAFMGTFEEKMLYRTTKTENPETTRAVVRRVLKKISSKI
jgi:hypothetical protein